MNGRCEKNILMMAPYGALLLFVWLWLTLVEAAFFLSSNLCLWMHLDKISDLLFSSFLGGHSAMANFSSRQSLHDLGGRLVHWFSSRKNLDTFAEILPPATCHFPGPCNAITEWSEVLCWKIGLHLLDCWLVLLRARSLIFSAHWVKTYIYSLSYVFSQFTAAEEYREEQWRTFLFIRDLMKRITWYNIRPPEYS